MSKKYSFIGLALLWSIALTRSAVAIHNFNTNQIFGVAGGSIVVTNWGHAALWDGGLPTGDGTDVNITNQFLQDTIITNAYSANNVGLNFLRVISGNALLSSSNVTVIVTTNLQLNFGFNFGSNATVVIGNTSTFGNNGNSSFNLGKTASQGRGTLIISNGAGVFLNFNDPIRNDGTIIFTTAAATQNSQINYGQNNGTLFTNNTGGTIVKIGSTGTGSFVGEFGGANKAFLNQGTIIINGGTQRLDPRDASLRGGFQNAGSGFVRVDANSVLEIRRTTNAWANPNASFPTNFGTVFMNGGEWRTVDSDGGPGNVAQSNTTRIVVNASGGVIRGNGLLDFTIRNEAAGSILEARDGVLTTVNAANNNGTWVSTNFGGNASVLNFTTGGFDLGAGTLLNSNGTIRLIGAANMTLSTSYRQNWGTIDIAGTASVWLANSASAGQLTNEFIIKKTGSGTATITTGFGPGGGIQNFGFNNRGTIDLISNGRLIINTSNAFSQTFMNPGTVLIANVSTLRIARTSAAWNGGSASPTNSGTITLTGGVFELADDTGMNPARFFRNAGTFNGTGIINASITNESSGTVAPGLSIGTLNLAGNLVSLSNSALTVELNPVTTQCDLLAVAGSVTLDANSKLNISGGVAGNVYTVMTYSARTGTFGTNTPGYTLDYLSSLLRISPIQATFTINASITTPNGTISPSGSVIVSNGNDQTFNITPDTCYQVADVLVDGNSVGAASSYTFFGVSSNHTITAGFTNLVYTITASAGSGGLINPSGAVSVICGNDELFSITPNLNHHVLDVLVDSVSVGAVSGYTFTNVTGPHTISASFAIDTYAITATAGNNGTISPSGAVSVNAGDNQTFTITPDSCYHIDDVLVDAGSVGAVSSFTFTNVLNNRTIDAAFAIDTYTIVATAGTNGTISPAGTLTVNCGTNADFTITADAGYPTVDVLVDSNSVGVVTGYSFTNIVANHTLDATFATNLFQILSISRQTSDVQLVWPTVGGHSYILQSTAGANGSYSNDFTDLSTLAIPGIGESTTNHVDEGGATNSPARFYRIRLAP